ATQNRTLTITAGTGTATFQGNVGTTQALADLDVTATTINLAGATVRVEDQGGNTATFTGAVVLQTDVTIDTDGTADNNRSVVGSLNGTTNGTESLTVTGGTGTVSLQAVGTTTALEFLSITTSGTITLNGNISTDVVGGGTGNVSVSGGGNIVL